MSDTSLTPPFLAHKHIAELAALLEHNFQYHQKQQTLFQQDYIPHLKTAIGLSFTAILVDSLYVSMHKADWHLLLDYFSTLAPHDSIEPIALAAAKIIDTGAHLFRKQYPCSDYYNAFAKALKRVVQSSLLDESKKGEQSQRFLQKMLRNSLF